MTAKKPATRKRPAKRTPARARRAVKPGVHGPAPLVLRGFTWTSPTTTNPDGTARWTPKAPAAEVLAALSIGATWEHSAHYARLHADTPSAWNNRGVTAFAGHPTLAAYAATDPDFEDFVYAAFHVAAAHARGAPVVGALEQIDRARRAGDWKAGAHLLRVLPQGRAYTEITRQEVTGPEGGAIPVEARVAQLVERARALADQPADPGEVDEDQAGDG